MTMNQCFSLNLIISSGSKIIFSFLTSLSCSHHDCYLHCVTFLSPTFNFSYLFWNQTWTTRMSRPVSWDSCSRTCLAGFGLVLYASLRVSSCFAVIVVRGLLLGWSPSILPPSASSETSRKLCIICLVETFCLIIQLIYLLYSLDHIMYKAP